MPSSSVNYVNKDFNFFLFISSMSCKVWRHIYVQKIDQFSLFSFQQSFSPSFGAFFMSLQIYIMEFDATSLLILVENCFPE